MKMFLISLSFFMVSYKVGAQVKKITYDTLFCGTVEMEASFPGGEPAW
jgi:hypothetical protein